jgi:hypothetical protein
VIPIRCSAADCPGHNPINPGVCPTGDPPISQEVTNRVFEGVTLSGQVNVEDAGILENVQFAIRQQHPQIWPQQPRPERVCLVGGGPSLADTEQELVNLVYEGAQLVTCNGAYQWCLDRHLKPNGQVVVDARAHNARFVNPPVPGCRYYVASQAHPETWRAVAGREWVAIFHSASGDNDVLKPVLDEFYHGAWVGVTGGSTVILRAIGLLRILGYLRFDLFGVDSCWLGAESHAYAQPENAKDQRIRVKAFPPGGGEGREFVVSPWHLAQAEDFIRFIRVQGNQFLLNVHGRGLLRYMLESSAEVVPLDHAGAQSA